MKYLEYRDSSDRLVIAIEGLPSMAYRFVRWKLCRRFGLRKSDTYIKDLDSKFQTFNRADEQLSIDWDAWSGFMVVALNPGSENLAKELGMWLKEKYIDQPVNVFSGEPDSIGWSKSTGLIVKIYLSIIVRT